MLPLYKTTKDPNDNLDYTADFSQWFDETSTGDTITSAAWTVTPGLTQGNSSHTDTTATVWLSGGVVGKTYTAQCTMTSVLGRIATFSLEILIQKH